MQARATCKIRILMMCLVVEQLVVTNKHSPTKFADVPLPCTSPIAPT